MSFFRPRPPEPIAPIVTPPPPAPIVTPAPVLPVVIPKETDKEAQTKQQEEEEAKRKKKKKSKTILTSPRGIEEEAPVGQKTLMGQ